MNGRTCCQVLRKAFCTKELLHVTLKGWTGKRFYNFVPSISFCRELYCWKFKQGKFSAPVILYPYGDFLSFSFGQKSDCWKEPIRVRIL